MSDLIDRQAAIDAHYEYCNKHPDAGFPVWSLKILEDLPSAQPEHIKQTLDEVYAHAETEAEARYHAQQRWIPCSERLPEKDGDVLCCRNNKTMDIMHFNPVSTTRYPKGFSMVRDAFSWRQDNVIAWMPLPEPYREEGD